MNAYRPDTLPYGLSSTTTVSGATRKSPINPALPDFYPAFPWDYATDSEHRLFRAMRQAGHSSAVDEDDHANPYYNSGAPNQTRQWYHPRFPIYFYSPADDPNRSATDDYTKHVTDYDIDGIVSVVISRGNDSPASTPTPATMTLEIRPDVIDPATLQPGRGLVMSLAYVMLGRWQLGIPGQWQNLTPTGALAPWQRFRGQVTDQGPLQLRKPAGARGTMQVILASPYSRLNQVKIGLAPWPAGTGDNRIISDAAAAAQIADPGLAAACMVSVNQGIGGGNVMPLYPTQAQDGADPASASFVQFDVDNRPVDDIFKIITDSIGGQITERRDGTIRWMTPERRRNAAVAANLTADMLLEPLTVSRRLSDVVNAQTAVYGDTSLDARPTVYVEDTGSTQGTDTQPVLGLQTGDDLDTILGDVDLATARAADQVGRYGRSVWQLDDVTVDVMRLLEAGNLAAAGQLASLEIGDLVNVDGLPDYSPLTPGLYWLQKMTETFTHSSWTMTLKLLPYALLAPAVRYQDIDAAYTYDAVPDDVTYARATVWQPTDPIPAGSYRRVGTNVWYTKSPGIGDSAYSAL